MYTVIIAEKKHFEAIKQNSLYFKPFLDRANDDFAFCEWIPGGETLYECVPELVRSVGRHKSWRAVIVTDDVRSDSQNPYDAIDHKIFAECEEKYRLTNPADDADDTDTVSSVSSGDTVTEAEFDAWKAECAERLSAMLAEKRSIFKSALSLPLQRLVTCLCYVSDGLPVKKLVKKGDVGDYVHGKLDPLNFEKHLMELEHFYHLEEDRLKNELRRECVEEMLPGDGRFKRKGSMGIALPDEVICFAERTTETGFFDAQVYWENHMGFEYSSFVVRNMYFDKMRFIVQDILPSTHQNYRYDRIRFLYNLLLFSVNEVPSGTLLPRKLYYLESENNEEALSTIVSAYIGKLDNTIDVVNGQIETIKRQMPQELDDSDVAKLFCAKVNIPVSLAEDFSEEALYAEQNDYGYFVDSFGDDHATWRSQRTRTGEAVERLVKQPRRALKKSVDKMDRECLIDYNMIRAMNSFQMDDVREHTDSEKDRMVSMEVTNIFDLSRYKKELDEESSKVEAVIDRRMKKKTNILLGAVCLGVFLITFLPIIFTNRGNINTTSVVLMFVAIACALLVAVMAVAVILMRLPLKNALNDYNQKSREINNEVRSAMSKYSDYLSCVCNIIRGYKVQNFNANHIDKYDRDIRIRKKHKNDMEKIRAVLADNYGDFIDDRFIDNELSVAPYDYDFSREKAEYDYYPPYLPDDNYKIDYLEAGNTVTLPSDFVRKVTVRMEEIYDN